MAEDVRARIDAELDAAQAKLNPVVAALLSSKDYSAIDRAYVLEALARFFELPDALRQAHLLQAVRKYGKVSEQVLAELSDVTRIYHDHYPDPDAKPGLVETFESEQNSVGTKEEMQQMLEMAVSERLCELANRKGGALNAVEMANALQEIETALQTAPLYGDDGEADGPAPGDGA